VVRPEISKEKLGKIVDDITHRGINLVQLADWYPAWGVIVPKTDVYIRSRPLSHVEVSVEKIRLLGELLHKKGIKLIGYDEICSDKYVIYGPLSILNDGKRYSIPFYFNIEKRFPEGKPIAFYNPEWGYEANLLDISSLYISEMKKSISMFGWDGFFFDSFSWIAEATSFGKNKDGKPITNFSPDKVMYNFLKKMQKQTGKNFAFIGNMGLHDGYPFPPISPELATYKEAANLLSGWCIEIPGKPLVKKSSIYPQTFLELVKTYKNLRGIYPKTNFFVVYNSGAVTGLMPEQIKTLWALAHGSGLGVYYNAPPYYTIFSLFYGNLLYSPDLVETDNINVNIEGEFIKLCKELTYRNNKDNFYIIHLINVKEDSICWDRSEIKERENLKMEITFKQPEQIKDIYYIDADGDEIGEIKKIGFKKVNNTIEFVIPKLYVWGIVLIVR
ncbi:MAG: hypothetical protein NC824_01590, partial [Candidatus Omnitrophica bacterium]|nr:hypothetical protein [Candidatus Omnitrophota bacterium]